MVTILNGNKGNEPTVVNVHTKKKDQTQEELGRNSTYL